MAELRIGTCSWADDALSKHWYPKGLAPGERLPYYAEHFDTVEVDSTYYRLPEQTMVERWAQRTPDGFVMHVKAFGLMTRHPVRLEQVPPELREGLPVDQRGRVDRPPREARAAVFRELRQHLAFPKLLRFVKRRSPARQFRPACDGKDKSRQLAEPVVVRRRPE